MDYKIDGKIIRVKQDPTFVGNWLMIVEKDSTPYYRFKSYGEVIDHICDCFCLDKMELEELQVVDPFEKLELGIKKNKESSKIFKLEVLDEIQAAVNMAEYLLEDNKTCLCGCGKPTKKLFAPGHDMRVIGMIKRYESGEHIEFNTKIFDLLTTCKNCGKTIVYNNKCLCHDCSKHR